MNVLLAEEMGFCFGVRDALKTLDEIAKPENVTIHGQLVHNEGILHQLMARGFRMVSESDRQQLAATETVLITAHGISQRERSRLEAAGKKLVDTTCPLVGRVHETALRLQAEGHHIILIGRNGHVEVRGIVEDLQSFDIVGSAEEVKKYQSRRLAIVCQTTVAPRTVSAVHHAIIAANPDAQIRFVDTTCQPTRNRQRAVEKLLPLVEVMVVVGGNHSNNTRELVELCKQRGRNAYQVRDAGDLRADWFRGVERVGLTAGTSTPDETIRSVAEWLRGCCAETAEQEHSRRWREHFRLYPQRQLPILWEAGAALSDDDKKVLIPSLQDFQLGESSEGKHGRMLAASYAQRVGDPGYTDAVSLFFEEEGRHAALLRKYLELAGFTTIQRSWTDFFFRRIRRLMGLETLITVLLTAELIGKVYYQAIHAATRCRVLRQICTQLLRDEKMHLRFHIERLRIMRTERSRWRLRLGDVVHRSLFFATCLAVWKKHGRAMRKGGYGFANFWTATWQEFRNASTKR